MTEPQILIESKSEWLDRLMVPERPGKVCFRFWQKGAGFDRNLFSPEPLEASIDSIHNNPVKRGSCEKATDWIWSSARFNIFELPKLPNYNFRNCPTFTDSLPGAFEQGQPN